MKTMLRSIARALLGLAAPVASFALTRTVDITPPGAVYAGQTFSVSTSASTDAGGGEQIGFYHAQYSTDGGTNWTWFAGDVNAGASATRNATITAGAAGSTIMIRVRIAFRGGSAGDVDYAGGAINWEGSWDAWQTPPTKSYSFVVATKRTFTITPPVTATAGQPVTFVTNASTDGPGGEQIGFYHIEYSNDGGANWTASAYDQNLGPSASRTVSFTAGSAGSTAMVRARLAYRNGTAGDVDYAGGAINWGGSWSTWSSPPAKSSSVAVVSGNTLIGTASSAGTYHLAGTIVKAGHATDPMTFGDGVVVEVFKRSGTTDTVLWSSLLARPNAANPAKVNLTVALASGDTLRYRLVSHTSDTNYDSLTGATSFTMKSSPSIWTTNVSASGTATSALNTALQNAKSAINGGGYDRAEVILDNGGTYYLQDSGAGNSEALLALSGTQNVTLRGNNSKLIINSATPKMFLDIASSANIEIRDVEFDYADAFLPYLQGTVSGFSGNNPQITLTYTPDSTNISRFANTELFSYKWFPSSSEPVGDRFEITNCAISGNVATVTLKSGYSLSIGDNVVMSIRGDTARLQEAALRFSSTTDCTLANVTLRAGGWIALIGRGNNGLHFDHYVIDRANTTRWMTTNGDAIQLKDSLRGPSVENCTFRRMLDDGINLHATINDASSSGGTTFTKAGGNVQVGDIVQVFERQTGSGGQAVGFGTFYKVTGVSGSTVTVDQSVSSSVNKYVNVSASGEGFLIRHTTFEQSRNRGCLIQTGYGWIDDNDFIQLAGVGLSFDSNLSNNGSVEGPFPHHTPVTANYFYRTSYGGDPAILILGLNLGIPPTPMFVGLAGAISRNTFYQQTANPVLIGVGTETYQPVGNNNNP